MSSRSTERSNPQKRSSPKQISVDAPAVEVVNARTHNLKGVNCRVPHGAVTVATGPSGAGKSSLAFNTIYAEGQRRFVESMSTYARQFLDQMERPPVDSVDNILPSVALEARNSIKNARSTVGTITEVHDVLRLMFTHLGQVQCPNGHGPLRRFEAEQAAAALAEGAAGDAFTIAVRLPRPKRRANDALGELIRQGFARRIDGEKVVRLEPGDAWPKDDDLVLALGRYKAGGEPSMRMVETVEEGYRLGRGRIEVVRARSADVETGLVYFSAGLGCGVCGSSARRPVPAMFSFNSPLGACSECQGFGRVIGIDPERVIPDPTKTLDERAIASWNTPAYEKFYKRLFAAAAEQGVPLDVPWQDLSAKHREWVWSGKGSRSAPMTNLNSWFAGLERKIYKVHVRVLLARYRSYNTCPVCQGRRLKSEVTAVELHGLTLPELTSWSIERLRGWVVEQQWTDGQREIANHLIEELNERLDVLIQVGLEYLTLDRQARTLSGGESQRIHLAASLGSGLTSTLYILDEPTIGLHPQDSDRLLGLLRELAERGNTVLVVEHDRTIIRGADHVIDLGPQAGENGGEVIVEGSIEDILASEQSLTGRYLRERPATQAREHLARFRREHGNESLSEELETRPMIRILGARENNLRGIDVEMPHGSLVAVTGVSGSGKSTLVENVLYGTYQRARGVVDVEPGQVDALEGVDGLVDITLVDQRPLGRSTRSNPITYVKAYDDIRKLFAATPIAKARGIQAGHFSFNTDRGRCPECKGTGVIDVDMQFMASVTVSCDVCLGRRFKPEILAIRLDGRTIYDVLELTVDAAHEIFQGRRRLRRRLEVLRDVGLGYLRLGQPTSTLSGGEAQRLKLASFLDRPKSDGSRLFIFDEPTTGLHLSDIDLLYSTLRRLVQRDHTVVVVEHSEDLIARCDWLVELGPGGGVHGGELLYSGPLEPFLDEIDSPTADELRSHLRWARLRSRSSGSAVSGALV